MYKTSSRYIPYHGNKHLGSSNHMPMYSIDDEQFTVEKNEAFRNTSSTFSQLTYNNIYHVRRNKMHTNMHIQPLIFFNPWEDVTSDKYATTPCASM